MTPRAALVLLLLPTATACVFDRGGIPEDPDLGPAFDLPLGDGCATDLAGDNAGCAPTRSVSARRSF
jgi:hypothetical protein